MYGFGSSGEPCLAGGANEVYWVFFKLKCVGFNRSTCFFLLVFKFNFVFSVLERILVFLSTCLVIYFDGFI